MSKDFLEALNRRKEAQKPKVTLDGVGKKNAYADFDNQVALIGLINDVSSMNSRSSGDLMVDLMAKNMMTEANFLSCASFFKKMGVSSSLIQDLFDKSGKCSEMALSELSSMINEELDGKEVNKFVFDNYDNSHLTLDSASDDEQGYVLDMIDALDEAMEFHMDGIDKMEGMDDDQDDDDMDDGTMPKDEDDEDEPSLFDEVDDMGNMDNMDDDQDDDTMQDMVEDENGDMVHMDGDSDTTMDWSFSLSDPKRKKDELKKAGLGIRKGVKQGKKGFWVYPINSAGKITTKEGEYIPRKRTKKYKALKGAEKKAKDASMRRKKKILMEAREKLNSGVANTHRKTSFKVRNGGEIKDKPSRQGR